MSMQGRYSASTHYDVSTILRPSEKVTVTLPCRVRTDGLEYHRSEAAIVTHSSSGRDAAALMVIVAPTEKGDVRIPYFLPITSTFKHSLNQTPPSPSTSFFHQSSRPHITLTVQNDMQRAELRISSSQTVRVQSLTSQLRRLVDATSGPKALSTVAELIWMKYYPLDPPAVDVDLKSETEIGSPGESSISSFISPESSSTSIQTIAAPMAALDTSLKPEEEDHYPSPFDPDFSRLSFLRKRLFAKQEMWSTRKDVSVRMTTYNVNDKLPPAGTTELAPLAGAGEEDILVFGFQEADLRGQALLYSQGNSRADEWESALMRGLGEKATLYEKIALSQYVGVMTIVLAKKSIKEHIRRVETAERGIGLLGFGGNKAGVCVRLKIYDSTLAFVNSHLAAFATALDRRRNDYQTLLKGLTFPFQAGNDIVPAFEEFYSESTSFGSLEESHALFWTGDLNYRIEMEEDILRAWVEESKWESILAKDQLRSDIAANKSFAGFKEHPIDFAPTFKYVHGSTTFDTRRSPAYTDRILWSNPSPHAPLSPPHSVKCTSYQSHQILWSDHWPVSASFLIDVRVADEEKRKAEYVVSERELEKLEEVYRPALEITGSHLDFGEIRCLRPVSRNVTLRNKGRVPASFEFKSPSQGKPICKPTLWPFPQSGVIEPGCETELRITMMVDQTLVRPVTLCEVDLNDVLVLRVTGGKDTFITCQATFVPTILSQPLSLLISLPDAIRSVPTDTLKALAGSSEDAYEEQPKGPKPVKEIWRLLEFIMEHGPGTPALWTGSVDMAESLEILDHLDDGSDLDTLENSRSDSKTPKGQVEPVRNVVACLRLLLQCLPEPLIPQAKVEECEAVQARDDAFAALEGIDQVNTNVLIGLMSVVRLCLSPPAHMQNTDEDVETLNEVPSPSVSQATPVKLKTNEPRSPIGDLPTPPTALNDRIPPVEIIQATPTKTAPSLTAVVVPAENIESIAEVLVPMVFGLQAPEKSKLQKKTRFLTLLLEG